MVYHFRVQDVEVNEDIETLMFIKAVYFTASILDYIRVGLACVHWDACAGVSRSLIHRITFNNSKVHNI